MQARKQLVVDVAVRVRDRVGVLERHPLRVAEERALLVVVERLDLLCLAEPVADGSSWQRSADPSVEEGGAAVETVAGLVAVFSTESFCAQSKQNFAPERVLRTMDSDEGEPRCT